MLLLFAPFSALSSVRDFPLLPFGVGNYFTVGREIQRQR